jgi:hypothetical protein
MTIIKSNFIKSREDFFNKIVNKFPHDKLSNLIVSHKIDEVIFEKFSSEVKNYYNLSKKFNFQNMTPNGRLVPKKETDLVYNNILIYYREILHSMGLSNEISHYIIPVIRYKGHSFNTFVQNSPTRTELAHSDFWGGWGENTLLINIPISGDTENNKVVYYDLPNDAGSDFMERMSSYEGQKYVSRCKKLQLHYDVGNMYICDISVIHGTSREVNSKGRLSLDIPVAFKYHKTLQNNFLTSGAISAQEIQFLGKNFKLSWPSKMGQINGYEFHKITK